MIAYKKARKCELFYYRPPAPVAAVPILLAVGALAPPLVWIQLSGWMVKSMVNIV
jgi:hypothetical protein